MQVINYITTLIGGVIEESESYDILVICMIYMYKVVRREVDGVEK